MEAIFATKKICKTIAELSIPGSSYNKELAQKNWNKIERFTFQPTDLCARSTRLSFRGDSREPDSIFRRGFTLGHSPIVSDSEYLKSLNSMEIIFKPMNSSFEGIPTGLTNYGVQNLELTTNTEKAVCFSDNPFLASCFPRTAKTSTYVYSCLVVNGISLSETANCLSFKPLGICTYLTNSLDELITTCVPPEHILGCWQVSRTTEENIFSPIYSDFIANENCDPCVDGYQTSLKDVQLLVKDKVSVNTSSRSYQCIRGV